MGPPLITMAVEQEGSNMAHCPEGIPSNTVSVCSREREWSEKLVCCHCDNTAVVEVFNSRDSQDKELMSLRNRAFSFSHGGSAPAREGEYSSGCTITKPPLLFSTGNSDKVPIQIPSQLLMLLVEEQPDISY